MEGKDPIFPRMYKPQTQKQTNPSFKVRPNLISKEKQNKIHKSFQQAKAQNFINNAKSFNSPQLIFALNQTIRQECHTLPSESVVVPTRYTVCGNKTFHSSTDSKSVSKFYSFDKARDRTIELSKWVTQKLNKLKQKNSFSLDDVLDYNQTVVNYGLGQLIESVRSKCKQEGQLLKFVWDNTFVMFQWVVNVLTKEIDKKDKQIIDNQKELEQLYRTSMSFITKQNKQLQTHIDLLYDKMKKVVIWNRRLRKDRFKQEIQIRMRDYRLETYTSALEQATQMLLTQSRQPNCLKLARKIISKLYRQKGIKSYKKYRRNKMKMDAKQHVHETSKQFVMNWLKKYSFAQNQKIENAIFLTEDQKMEIMKLSDQNELDSVDIYDFFQTANQAVQTQRKQVNQQVQYEKYLQNQMKNVGVQTKRVYKMTVGIQNVMVQNQLQKMSNGKSLSKRNDTPVRSGNRKLTRNESNIKIRKNERSLTKFATPQLKKKSSNQKNFGQSITRRNSILNSPNKNKFKGDNQDLEQIQMNNYDGVNENDKQFYNIDDTQSVDLQKLQSQRQLIGASATQIRYQIKQNLINNKHHGQKITKFMLINEDVDKEEDKNEDIGDEDAKSQFSLFKSGVKETKNSIPIFKTNIRKLSSQRYITQSSQQNSTDYKSKLLQFKKFDEAYQSQMKTQVQQNKEEMIKTVVRRRSFYKPNKYRQQDNEKALMFLWYKSSKVMDWKPKRQLNKLDQQIYTYFSNLNKKLSLPVNFPKSKAFQQTCSLFTSVSNALSINQSRSPLPRNKQFISLSVASITKFISRLLFDYLRKIRSQREGISLVSQPERVYYPLSIVIVDHMMHQYGLREIAQKKLKDFMQKIGNFVTVSQRLAFFYKLIGFGQQTGMAADELLIYMKCLVLLDTSRTIPIMSSITKDFTVDRMVTDKQTVLQNVGQIIKEFFRENLRSQVKWKIQRYFHVYQLNGTFDIQRIAAMLIEEFLAVKKAQYEHYLPIYKNCTGNFFPNLRKTLEVFCQTDTLQSKYKQTMQEMFKSADILDQNYGKSMSELRFIGLCVRLNLPNYDKVHQKMKQLQIKFIKAVNVKQITEQGTLQGEQYINKIKKKYNIKIGIEKQASDYWTWTCAQISYDVSMMNAYNLLGHLGNLKSCYQSLCP